MTIAAPDTNKLRELDEDVRRVWNEYQERVQELSGDEYEQAETEAWTILQDELRQLERQRDLITTAPADDG